MLLNDTDSRRRMAGQSLVAWLAAPGPCRLYSTALGEAPEPVLDERQSAWSATHAHRLPYREVLLAVRGTAAFGWRGGVWACPPGSVFLLEVGDAHDLGYPPWTDGLLHLWVSLAPGHAAGNLVAVQGGRTLTVGRVHTDAADGPAWPDLSRLWTQYAGDATLPPAAGRHLLQAAIRLLLAELARELLAHDPPARAAAELRRQAVQTACRLIRQAAGPPVPLDALARAAGYSKFHFLRLFTQQTGFTVRQYTDRCRLEEMAALRQQGLRQKEIAGRLGFSSPAAFSRWWRRHGPGVVPPAAGP